jgi:hypothetical protein
MVLANALPDHDDGAFANSWPELIAARCRVVGRWL